MILDSGERRQFETGSVRDMSEGKGRFDIMPLSILHTIEDDPHGVLFYMGEFQRTGECRDLRTVAELVIEELFVSSYHAYLELAKHFENGLKKYGLDNWKHGIPASSYLDSCARHYCKHKAGHTDEPHDVACLWNLVCCMWTIENKPEMNDYHKEEE